MLFHVYDAPKPAGYFINEPQGFYRNTLDADWVMYLLLPGLLIAVIVGLMYAWHLHELPKHKAERKKMRQAELVSALTLLGLFVPWVWAVALFIAYMDWDAVDDWVLSIARRARDATSNPPTDNSEPEIAAADLEAPVGREVMQPPQTVIVDPPLEPVDTPTEPTSGRQEPRP
jgi:hypothetical protein